MTANGRRLVQPRPAGRTDRLIPAMGLDGAVQPLGTAFPMEPHGSVAESLDRMDVSQQSLDCLAPASLYRIEMAQEVRPLEMEVM